MSKPTWLSWTEYLQRYTRHYEPLTLEPHDVSALLEYLREIEQKVPRPISMSGFAAQ